MERAVGDRSVVVDRAFDRSGTAQGRAKIDRRIP